MIGFESDISPRGSAAAQSSGKSDSTSPASVIDGTALVPRSPLSLRTLADVREQVSQEIAVHTITKAQSFDGVRIGVRLVMSRNEDEDFLRLVAAKIQHQLTLSNHLFAIATIAQSATSVPSTLIISGSSQDYVQRAVLLASSKFIGRIVAANNEEDRWVATVLDLGMSPYDEEALWDVVRKAARSPMDPLTPPPGSRGIDDILSLARAKLQRVSPSQAYDELRETQVGAPTFLVDIRPQAQRELEGGIHGSLIIERNTDTTFESSFSVKKGILRGNYQLNMKYDTIANNVIMVISLAAYSLQQLGMLNATDIIGGYEAWKNEGLPIDLDRRESRSLLSLAGSVV
ncbi:hypothetical protein CVT25_012796 [Psilocybe cyanescens]|uniref:Rhodanese domain-containing protein n=1 Tax=Psilocybe cyanescens TaxID=93625 RepID=A0A409XLD8_PSICY|nr:hypothetical protein CVT25_012796 [Psilocybe cyanescens]